MEGVGSLSERCRWAFEPGGRLSTAIPGFVSRAPQSDLAVAIADAIDASSILVAEAGTGTGKTFAYLLPCLMSGKKTLISTATKTLQDQLYLKDLPNLVKAMGLSSRIQNLKGRANYICQHRVELHAEEGQFQSPQCAHEIVHIREKMSQMNNGERSELPEISEDSPVWPYVTSTTDNCLGQKCPKQDSCFLLKARKKALQADVVVINHHLFFADSRLKQEGFGELLPGVEVAVFDEAHQLAEVATHFYGQRIGTRQFIDLMEDTINEWPILDLANQPLKALSHQTKQLMDALLEMVPTREDKITWKEVSIKPEFQKLWEEWAGLRQELLSCFLECDLNETPGLARCKERLEAINTILAVFDGTDKENILWVERFKSTLVFHATPYEIGLSFSKLLNTKESAYIFTSATLTMASSFECFCKPLGLDEAQTLLLPSPFDFKKQALLYFPRGLPDPKSTEYYSALMKRVLPVIEACGGRSFLLFTSHKALKLVAQMLHNTLHYPLLVQGSEAKPILLERFRQLGNAVLLGTATFWEGVDVKGEALSCVVIDKIPFASPVDPVVKGRMDYLKEQGMSGFDELSLPNAVIALKQGVGRLIRDVSDRGVLMIADPRLTSREYGRRILASLPPLSRTRDEEKVLTYIKELALDYETVSD